MIGKKFGTWEVIGKYQNKNNRFLCKCECGFMTIKYVHEIEKPSALSCMSCCKKNENNHFYGNKQQTNKSQPQSGPQGKPDPRVGTIINGDIREYITAALLPEDECDKIKKWEEVPTDDYVYIHKVTQRVYVNLAKLKAKNVTLIICNAQPNDMIIVEFNDKKRGAFINMDTLIKGLNNSPVLEEQEELLKYFLIRYYDRAIQALADYKNCTVTELMKLRENFIVK